MCLLLVGITGAVLTGIEALTLDFRVEWPLSLVLNKKTLTKFQLLFRSIFRCKYV